mmetsp:Transcript_121363/g.387982  ORF Transcript_121363/g.387982 Transcript_121363/m.387982 type:complete len:247 (+) Transcript_121363:1684-2424(+)
MCSLSRKSQFLILCFSTKSRSSKLLIPTSFRLALDLIATVELFWQRVANRTNPYAPVPMISCNVYRSSNPASLLIFKKVPPGGAAITAKTKATAIAPVSGNPIRISADVWAALPVAFCMKAVSRAPFKAASAMPTKPHFSTARRPGPKASANVLIPSSNSPRASTSANAHSKCSTRCKLHMEAWDICEPALKKKMEKSADKAPSTLLKSEATQWQNSFGLASGHFSTATNIRRAARAKFRPQSPFL